MLIKESLLDGGGLLWLPVCIHGKLEIEGFLLTWLLCVFS